MPRAPNSQGAHPGSKQPEDVHVSGGTRRNIGEQMQHFISVFGTYWQFAVTIAAIGVAVYTYVNSFASRSELTSQITTVTTANSIRKTVSRLQKK
jgi:hypothetical protein